MTEALLLVAALVLVAFGGFMAASEAALGVTSRADLVELGAAGRNARSLQRIADDPSAHVTAVVFIRVLAETTAAVILYATAHVGVPVSTTHVISTSIMGVGATKRLSAVKWGVVERILWAWVLTLPVTGLLGYGFERILIVITR